MRELERNQADINAPEEALAPIAVIGRGRVGGSITGAAQAAGIPAASAGREDLFETCAEAEIALICVPDESIPAVAAELAEGAPGLRFVGHVSGATRLDALAPSAAAGASLFSLHPLQTIPDPATPLTGAPAAIAGSDAAGLDLAWRLATALSMRPFEVAEEHRAAYHAAAAIASNFLVALEESAAELMAAAGIEEGRELLAPLVLRSAANWAERGGDALTGPIARGDDATVGTHIDALTVAAPELIPVYQALAERTRELASGAVES